jgi:hypothetical protein
LHVLVAFEREVGDVVENRHAGRFQFTQHGEALGDVGGHGQEPGQVRCRCPAIERRLQHCLRLDSGARELGGEEQQQRPGSGQYEAPLRHQGVRLEQGLSRTARKNARQRPAGYGQGAFHRAGCDQSLLRGEDAGRPAAAVEDTALGLDLPNLRAAHVLDVGRTKRAGEIETGRIVGPQYIEMLRSRRGEAFDAAVDLSARLGLFVEYDDAQFQR